jgi:mRNA-degrading endonuclease RelE of RelBE toxin-antitoxin system
MHRSQARVAGPYHINFTPEAWRRIGLLPSSTFQALQSALDDLASNLGSRRPQGEDAHNELRMQAAGLLLVYQRDDETRTLTLLDFLPGSSER